MKHGFARKDPVKAPAFAPETIELPTPLKVPPPQSKPIWSVVLIIGLTRPGRWHGVGSASPVVRARLSERGRFSRS